MHTRKLAKLLTDNLIIPTIGIGAGFDCDGQVLVTPDITGMFRDFIPKHTKIYADFGNDLERIVKLYINEVKEQRFPEERNTIGIDENVLKELKGEYYGREVL